MTPDEKKTAQAEIKAFIKRFYSKYQTTPIVTVNFDNAMPPITLDELLEMVNREFEMKHTADYHGVYQSKGIQFKSREQDILLYRQIYFKMARDYGFTLTSIGKSIDINHATVLHGAKLITKDKSFSTAAIMQAIRERIYIFVEN